MSNQKCCNAHQNISKIYAELQLAQDLRSLQFASGDSPAPTSLSSIHGMFAKQSDMNNFSGLVPDRLHCIALLRFVHLYLWLTSPTWLVLTLTNMGQKNNPNIATWDVSFWGGCCWSHPVGAVRNPPLLGCSGRPKCRRRPIRETHPEGSCIPQCPKHFKQLWKAIFLKRTREARLKKEQGGKNGKMKEGGLYKTSQTCSK